MTDDANEDAAVIPPAEAPRVRKPRGFAAMNRDAVRKIASSGGKAAHAKGTAHQFTTEEAKAAGHLGGIAPHVRRGRGKTAKEG